MTIAFACILFMGILPIICAGISKKGFEVYLQDVFKSERGICL